MSTTRDGLRAVTYEMDAKERAAVRRANREKAGCVVRYNDVGIPYIEKGAKPAPKGGKK